MYASAIGVPAQYVEAFNGVDASIHAIFDVYGQRGSTFLTTAPTFGYYKPCALQHGMLQDEVLYLPDLSFPLETIKHIGLSNGKTQTQSRNARGLGQGLQDNNIL